jgi:hypothetical protein
MTCLSAAERAAIEAEIEQKQAQLVLANETYSKLLVKVNKEYKFNSNEGQQWATKRDLKELENTIEWLERSIDSLMRRIRGQSLVNMNLRRKPYNRLSGRGRIY